MEMRSFSICLELFVCDFEFLCLLLIVVVDYFIDERKFSVVCKNMMIVHRVSYLYATDDYCATAAAVATGGRYSSKPGHFCSIK
jgi:hypothetical protein